MHLCGFQCVLICPDSFLWVVIGLCASVWRVIGPYVSLWEIMRPYGF